MPGAGAIVYGQPDGGRHPAVGVLYDGLNRLTCTGTLITPTHLLTAAHCINVTQGPYSVSFAEDGTGPVVDVGAVATMPGSEGYTSDSRTDDSTTVGYGAVRETKRGGWQSLQNGGTRMMAEQKAKSLTRAFLMLSMTQSTGDGGTCYGDSGGPHFLMGPGGSEQLVSITVTGDVWCKATDSTYRIDRADVSPSSRV